MTVVPTWRRQELGCHWSVALVTVEVGVGVPVRHSGQCLDLAGQAHWELLNLQLDVQPGVGRLLKHMVSKLSDDPC